MERPSGHGGAASHVDTALSPSWRPDLTSLAGNYTGGEVNVAQRRSVGLFRGHQAHHFTGPLRRAELMVRAASTYPSPAPTAVRAGCRTRSNRHLPQLDTPPSAARHSGCCVAAVATRAPAVSVAPGGQHGPP